MYKEIKIKKKHYSATEIISVGVNGFLSRIIAEPFISFLKGTILQIAAIPLVR